MTRQTWKSGKAIRPLITDPVTNSEYYASFNQSKVKFKVTVTTPSITSVFEFKIHNEQKHTLLHWNLF